MKKALLVIFTLSLVMALAANATETRVTTMGENNDVLKDENNIWLYPSTINFYPNLMGGVVSDGELGEVGGNWQIGQSVLGAYFSTSSYRVDIDDFDSFSMDHRINLFYGRKMGDMPVGLRLSMWGDGSRQENPVQQSFDRNYDYSYRRFEAAVGATMMEAKLDLSATIGMTSFTEEENYLDTGDVYIPYDNLASDGSFDFDLRARYWHEVNDMWTIVPHVAYGNHSLTVVDQARYATGFWAADTWEGTTTMAAIGIGTNYRASEKVMTVTDFGIQIMKDESELTEVTPPGVTPVDTYVELFEYSPSYVPYFKLGLEGEVKSWLDVRFGVVSEWHSSKSEYTETETDEDDYAESYTNYGVNARTYIGAGFNFGDFHIDTELNAQFLNDGPNFISGRSNGYYYPSKDSSDWAPQVSFRYDF